MNGDNTVWLVVIVLLMCAELKTHSSGTIIIGSFVLGYLFTLDSPNKDDEYYLDDIM